MATPHFTPIFCTNAESKETKALAILFGYHKLHHTRTIPGLCQDYTYNYGEPISTWTINLARHKMNNHIHLLNHIHTYIRTHKTATDETTYNHFKSYETKWFKGQRSLLRGLIGAVRQALIIENDLRPHIPMLKAMANTK